MNNIIPGNLKNLKFFNEYKVEALSVLVFRSERP